MSKETEEIIPAKPKRRKFGWTASILTGGLLAVVFQYFLVDTYSIPSASMDPTLEVGDYIISVPLVDNRNAPERGDIVVFVAPDSWGKQPNEKFVKRVIAVGGDIVECCSSTGKVKVNNEEIAEPYMVGSNEDKTYSFSVPEGSVFVLGDNRSNSADSRAYSDPFVPVENIVGQPFQIIYPLDNFGSLK